MLSHEHLISALDYDSISGVFTWRFREAVSKTWNTRYANRKAGRLRSDGYWEIIIDRKFYLASRIAWFYVTRNWPTDQIDHKDLNPLNNAFSNLREATPCQNQYNHKKPKSNTSGYKGVTKGSGNRWISRIRVNKKHIHLGTFDCLEAAHLAYCLAARENHKEFARTE